MRFAPVDDVKEPAPSMARSTQIGQFFLCSGFRPATRTRRIDIVDTVFHVGTVNRATLAEHPNAPDAKASINLRIETRTRRLIDEAAALLGKTRTEFMVDSARTLAIDVLLEQRLFTLDPARFDAFVDALDNPPAPGPKLRTLLSREPAWKR